jgi:uncharacterized protein with HEPN domain
LDGRALARAAPDRHYRGYRTRPSWERQWLVERGVEIISEASRHLTPELKARHPEIPWLKIAGIGNVLRHGYENIAAPVMLKLAQDDLDGLERVCRVELAGPTEQ